MNPIQVGKQGKGPVGHLGLYSDYWLESRTREYQSLVEITKTDFALRTPDYFQKKVVIKFSDSL